MSAPPKPWEGTGNFRSSPNLGVPGGLHSYSTVAQMPPLQSVVQGVMRVPAGSSRAAPPVPARLSGTAYRTTQRPVGYAGGGGAAYGMGSYGNAYGGYGSYGGYGTGLGGYGSYGAGGYGSPMYGYGGMGMNRYPQHGMNSFESRFIQMAEENSRPAFESIESLVQAFGSVAFMMESTFHAMYSSFRAVLGVAENFGRLRSLFGQVFETFAILRLFQWMYRKLLYYLGIRRENPGEAVWKQAAGQLDPKTRRTFWPVAMFLGLVCGGPFLVWRLLRSLNIGPTVNNERTNTSKKRCVCSTGPMSGNGSPPLTLQQQPSQPVTKNDRLTATIAADPGVCNLQGWFDSTKPTVLSIGVTLYDFNAATNSELTVKRGQKVWLAPQHLQPPTSDWVLITNNWKQAGLVPATYIHVLEQRKVTLKSKAQQDSVKPVVDAVDGEAIPEIAAQQNPLLTSQQQDPLLKNANQNSTLPLAADPSPQPLTLPRETKQNDEPSLIKKEQTLPPHGFEDAAHPYATPVWPVTNSFNDDMQSQVKPLSQPVQKTNNLKKSAQVSTAIKPKDADKHSESNS